MRKALPFAAIAFAWGAGAGELRAKSYAEVLPPDAILFLEVPDFPRAREAYLRLPRARLWWEGAGRRFIEKWIEGLDDEEFEVIADAFARAPACLRGKVMFALKMPRHGDEMGVPACVFLAEAGDRAGELKRLIVRMIGEDLVEEEEVEIEGVRFADLEGILVGSVGGTVIAAYDESGVRELLLRFRERPWHNLESNRAFQLARERSGGPADYFLYANFGAIWQLLAPDMMAEDWQVIESSGLSQLTATAFAGRFLPGGIAERWSFLLRGRARGMWKLLRPEPLSRKTWEGLPDLTSGFVSFNVDPAGRARPFLDLLRAIDEDEYEFFVEPFVDFREATGVSFQRDLLPLAAGEVTLAFLRGPEPPGGPVPGRRVFLAVELADAARAGQVMERLGWKGAARRRRFGELEGWQVELDEETSFFILGRGDIAYIAFVAEPIERIARALSEGRPKLTGTDAFKRATEWMPRETGFAAYSDVRELMRGLHRLAEHGCRRGGVAGLPAVEELMAGLSPVAVAVEVEESGFTLEIRSPHGFWPFYGQLAAYLSWKLDVEPAVRNEKTARPAFEAAMGRLRELEIAQEKLALLLDLRRKVAGTRYAGPVEEELMKIRALLREARGPGGEAAPVRGRVVAVDHENNLVLISAGTDQGVEAGMEFVVYRGGRRIATVEVEKVLLRMSSTKIVRRFGEEPIQEGDEVGSEEPEGNEPDVLF